MFPSLSIALITLASPFHNVILDRDNVAITQTCVVTVAANPIIDADKNGVIHITADNITVTFSQPQLHGASAEQTPDTFAGIGVKITGKNVTLKNLNVSGYKIGIHAINADGLTIHNCDVSNNFHQRLRSTPAAEDASDWLWPHANDDNEWITKYGAGICIEDSSNITLHNVRARKTQNGIILDRVNDSRIYDNDCSFLSGWGLAMWRSNRNIISRNAFDFCIRGYSHGVYNRGQDSAGILMFEQCCDNVIAENSATHGGDGFFGFAGKEALGEVNPRDERRWYIGRGNSNNIIIGNDFSFAAAHGLELTFSTNNQIWKNNFEGNAICGIWGGYSRALDINANTFTRNGEMAYGQERGGINIEHGYGNWIRSNTFSDNACGIHLWWDEDAGLLALPWAQANETGCKGNWISHNTFHRDLIAIQLADCTETRGFHNQFNDAVRNVQADVKSQQELKLNVATNMKPDDLRAFDLYSENSPVGARKQLAGRENIVMTEWGPWDHESPLLRFERHVDGAHEYSLRGVTPMPDAQDIHTDGAVFVEVHSETIRIYPKEVDMVLPYRFWIDSNGKRIEAAGILVGATWEVRAFPSTLDPREDSYRWRNEGEASPNAHILSLPELNLRFGSGGMSELYDTPVKLPRDHFGVIASTGMMFPIGTWRIKTTSDDGIRVWMDDQLVIDDWTWHSPTQHDHVFEVKEPRAIDFRVEYFELDGYAILSLEFERVAP